MHICYIDCHRCFIAFILIWQSDIGYDNKDDSFKWFKHKIWRRTTEALNCMMAKPKWNIFWHDWQTWNSKNDKFSLICPINYLQYNETRSADNCFTTRIYYNRWNDGYDGNEKMSDEATYQALYCTSWSRDIVSSVNTYYNLLRQARGHIITERNGMERNKTFI